MNASPSEPARTSPSGHGFNITSQINGLGIAAGVHVTDVAGELVGQYGGIGAAYRAIDAGLCDPPAAVQHEAHENRIWTREAVAEHKTPETISVVLNREDANRIFQAMFYERDRLLRRPVGRADIVHATGLAEKSRQWLLELTEPIEGTDR